MHVGVPTKYLYMAAMTELWLECCVDACGFPFAPGCQLPWEQARRQCALVLVSLARLVQLAAAYLSFGPPVLFELSLNCTLVGLT
jgi:hypothetical protein